MADKETKSTKTSANATEASKTTVAAKTTSPAKTAAPKAAKKAATAQNVVDKYSNTRGKKPTIVGEMKKEKAEKAQADRQEARQAAAATKAKAAADKSATTVKAAEAPKTTAVKTTAAKAAKEKPTAQDVVDKYSNTRGKKVTVVGAMKREKAQANSQAAEQARDPQRTQQIMLWILIGVLIAALLAGVVLTTVSALSNSKTPFVNQYASAQAVGYYAETLGTVDRVKPVGDVRNQGISAKGYPSYGKTLSLSTEEKTALIQESRYLTANGTWIDVSKKTSGTYDKMDKDGYLYLKDGSKPTTVGVPDRLYQHTASIGMYGGNVSDDEKAVIKKFIIRPRTYGGYYSVTGLYAPAGEVIKIELSDADMNATSGLTIHIGQALYNGQANNIWEQRGVNRMPVILNTMNITKDTATYDEETGMWTGYVGSFLGGPIYVRSESSTFEVTISGGVNYSHFILGATTKEEFEANAKSTAPYFDLEVWDRGVLHSGPKRQAAAFGYDDLYKAAVLWEKVSMVTTTGSNQGVVFLYDPFVAAGAAVAFPGRRSVNCPEGWMKQSLNYNGIVNGGSWGNFHEYHHNFQNYGLGSGADGEVTNNGLTLVSYSLFTKISSKRQISGYGGGGLSGWNQYTSATWALNRVNNGSITSTNGLAIYATLLHNFGQDQYIKARGASGKNNYLNKWANNTHQDMTYFANMIDAYGGGTYTPSQAVKDANYPLFVPVSSVYQTGRTYMYDNEKREITTMQPYVINYGDPFTVDLNPYTTESGQYRSGSVVIGKGFKYKIKNVDASGANGTFKETDTPGVYTFMPNSQLLSGKIYVTLEITTENGEHEWNGHALQDVDLILEFEQTHAKTKNILERTTYTYDPGKMYTDAEAAYNAGFAGYTSVDKANHSNPTQNCNTDIWFYPDTEANRDKYPNIPESHFAHENTVMVLEGKLYFEEAGKYRVYLRGRKNCAVYYSLDEGDKKKYLLGATIKDTTIPNNSAYFRPDDPNTYFDIEVKENSWMYFKEVLIVENAKASGTSFIGLGVKEWQEPMFTIQQKYYDKNGKEVAEDSPDIAKTETKYFNYLGIEVSADVANNSELIAPTINNSNQPYVNAYRSTYKDEAAEFNPDYFYSRNYTYNYTDNEMVSSEQTLVSTNYSKGNSWNYGTYPVENLTDGNRNTFIHTKNNVGSSQSKPLTMILDLGEVKTVNRMTMYTQNRPNGDWHCPKDFVLESSVDGNTFTLVGEFTNVPRSNLAITVDFEETQMRYYRLTIVGSRAGLIILGEIEMWHTFEVNGAQWKSPHDEQFSYYGNWKLEQAQATYGQVYVGGKNATMKFEFEGTRFGILSSSKFGTDFEVTIDGKVVNSVWQLKPFDELTGYTRLSYLSELLEEGKHEVVIKCKGEANIDSIAVYK